MRKRHKHVAFVKLNERTCHEVVAAEVVRVRHSLDAPDQGRERFSTGYRPEQLVKGLGVEPRCPRGSRECLSTGHRKLASPLRRETAFETKPTCERITEP